MSMMYRIEKLGEAKVTSPIHLGDSPGDQLSDFVRDDERVLADLDYRTVKRFLDNGQEPPSFEVAGPRKKIFFDGPSIHAGIVTCGGLCPGLNNVIRGLTMTLYHGYGVQKIYGFKYGYAGLNPEYNYPVLSLSPEYVNDIHAQGGTVLGTSRGPQDPDVMVDRLEEMGIRILFVLGGDGTFRGGLAIFEAIKRRKADIAIIGIPKTIDNDIILVDHTFGFETAVSEAAHAIRGAYTEAAAVDGGIGLVKLMGRHSGFIAASAALAVRNVNLVLVPELPFDMEGDNGLMAYMERRFQAKKSTVIVVAEGAGQKYVQQSDKDASGNAKLGDIGLFLKQQIADRFKGKYPFAMKYIDPSYIIRSQPANAMDSIFCGHLAQAAAHAGMSGRTGMAVGRSHRIFTHIPFQALVSGRKTVDPEGALWLSVLESTGQPFYLINNPPKKLSRASYYSTNK